MIRLPFFNKYPYTNFEQLNLDWLMNTVGSFESRVEAVETKVSELDTKVDTFDGRITQNAEDIAGIKTRLDNDEDDIDGLKTRMSAAESDIDDLETDVGTLGTDVGDLKTRMTAAESDIDDLETDVGTLTTRVDGIPDVEANPGGAVTGSLVTLKIGDTIYQITGGGGGQGTEVIANPTGTAVNDLTKVSIAGVIYDIPQSTVDSALNTQSNNAIANAPVATAINGINTDLASKGSDITSQGNRITAIENTLANLGTYNEYNNNNTGETLGYTNTELEITLAPGTYLILCETVNVVNGVSLSGGAFHGWLDMFLYNRTAGRGVRGSTANLYIGSDTGSPDQVTIDSFTMLKLTTTSVLQLKTHHVKNSTSTAVDYDCYSTMEVLKIT